MKFTRSKGKLYMAMNKCFSMRNLGKLIKKQLNDNLKMSEKTFNDKTKSE